MSVLKPKCTKVDFGWCSAPDPAGGAYSTPPDLLAVFKGAGREGKRRERGKEREREGKGRERDSSPLPVRNPGYTNEESQWSAFVSHTVF